MKIKYCATAAAMILSSGVFAVAANFSEATPGGFPKTYVGLLFDVMQTKPENILANADQFAEHAPYLDGVAIGLHDIPVTDAEGNVSTSRYHLIMHATERWTRDAVKDQLPYLKEIAKKPHLKESLLLFWMTPGGKNQRLDWTDDKAWANYAENMATVAWLAKQSGLKGLMLDPEEYGAQGGKLAQYIHCWKDPSFPETAKLARQRGREVFSRVFKEFPDAVIWSLWCFKKFGFWLEQGRQPFPVENIDQSGELLHYFLNGMLDVLPPEARIVDGNEAYSKGILDNHYLKSSVLMSTTVLSLIAPENLDKYRSQFYFSNTHYLDMYKMDANPKSLWYFGPVDGSRLEHMRLNFEQSLQTATQYVWIYGEGSGKLFNWRDGNFDKKKTWEEIAPGMTETIMLVKNPLGFAAKRKAALEKEGKLKNLAKDLKPLAFKNESKAREFRLAEDKMPSVKGLKAGERYYFTINVAERGAEKDTFREGTAIPRVFWRKDGKRTSHKPLSFTMQYGWGRAKNGYVTATLTAEVPEGADEIVFDLGAKLGLEERVTYYAPEMYNLFEAPIRKKTNRKWVFDPEKKTLSDGNWTLGAHLNKKLGVLTVRGDNENTAGSGILDLSGVKADTGHPVVNIGKFKNVDALTALIAPDVASVCDGGFSGSSNITSVVVGNIKVGDKANTPEKVRLDRLSRLRIPTRTRVAMKTFDHRNRRISKERVSDGLSVKGVKPGELYAAGLSMKRRGPGFVFLNIRFRGEEGEIKSKEIVPSIVMRGPRQEDVWQSGEVVFRIPAGANEFYYEIAAEVTADHTAIEIGDFTAYKIGDPLPVWPAECLREKERR